MFFTKRFPFHLIAFISCVRLSDFQFRHKNYLKTVAEEFEQLLRRMESRFHLGVDFLYATFEVSLEGVRSRPQSKYESVLHDGSNIRNV